MYGNKHVRTLMPCAGIGLELTSAFQLVEVDCCLPGQKVNDVAEPVERIRKLHDWI